MFALWLLFALNGKDAVKTSLWDECSLHMVLSYPISHISPTVRCAEPQAKKRKVRGGGESGTKGLKWVSDQHFQSQHLREGG